MPSSSQESHPDKNPDMNPDEAADRFRKVVDAFEFLSDPRQKQQYDNRSRHQQQRGAKERTRREREQKAQEALIRKHRARILGKARAAQKFVIRFSSFEELAEAMLDDKGVYKTHFLCAFVGNRHIERYVDDELLFPYPFAGVGENDLEWKDVVQVFKVRYNSQTSLTQAFRVPQKATTAHIVFAKKGDPIGRYTIYRPTQSNDPRREVESWVRAQLKFSLTIINYHGSPVELYIVEGQKVRRLAVITKRGRGTISVHPSDKIVAIDSKLDRYPGATRNVNLLAHCSDEPLAAKFIVKTESFLEIKPKKCVDMSLNCGIWLTKMGLRQCSQNPEFMHNICAATCGVCSEYDVTSFAYGLLQFPTSWLPSWVPSDFGESIVFLRVYLSDFNHVRSYRKNAAAAFFIAGVLIGMNLVLLGRWLIGQVKFLKSGGANLSAYKGIFLCMTMVFFGTIFWVATAPKIPLSLYPLQKDFLHILKFQMDALLGLFCVGFLGFGLGISGYRYCVSTALLRDMKAVFFRITILAAIISNVAVFMFGITFYLMESDNTRSRKWSHLWVFRKNAAFIVVTAGVLGGAVCSMLKQAITGFHLLILQLLINALSLASVSIVSSDRKFMKELEHVFDFRMNVMASFIVAGLLCSVVGVAKLLPKMEKPKTQSKVQIE